MTKMLRGMWESWFGRSQWRDERPARLQVSGWVAVGALLAAFVGGYLIGGRFGGKAADGGAVLQANRGQKAGFIDIDGKPLTRNAFIVAVYSDMKEDEAKASAKSLSDWLIGKNLKKAHPYLAARRDGQGTFWTVAVFFANEDEQRATLDLLRALRDVPDASFVDLQKNDSQWPRVKTNC